jgi:spermidine synthase
MTAEPRRILQICLFLSGASSLVLEVAWSRALSLSLGNSHQAVATVVASMMAGLCLGSLMAARLLPRLRRLPRAYGLVEIGIGLYAALTPLAFKAIPGILAPLYSLPPSIFATARFLLVFLLLLPAAGGMGATLPIVTAALSARRRGTAEAGGVVASPDSGTLGGRLYGLNTLGAFLGTLLGGFAFLPHLGLLKSTLLAAATSAGIGLLVVSRLGRIVRGLRDAPPPGGPVTQRVDDGDSAAGESRATGEPDAMSARWILVLYALSGSLAMVYEVTWTRALAPVVGTSVYSFTLILAAILAGIGLGSLLISTRRAQAVDPGRGFVAAQIALALAAFASVWGLKYFTLIFIHVAARTATRTWALFLGEFAMLAAIVFLPGMILGALFPFAARLAGRAGAEAGADVGRAYAWNTAGSIVGSLAAGFVLVETLGSENTLVLACTATACLALLALTLASGRRFRLGAGAAATVAAFAFPFFSARWDPAMMAGGITHVLRQVRSFPDVIPASQIPGKILPLWDRVVFQREGKSATVTVVRNGPETVLLVDGKVDAGTNADDMVTQVMLGQLPFLFARQSTDVCVIGYGSGVTSHAVLTHPVTRLDTIEIERQVIEASRFFSSVNGDPLADPRNHLILEDARTALMYRPQAYDIIISEPSNPWIAGVNNLFTREFYRLARRRLRPGGIFCQWMQTYEMSEKSFRTILNTLAQVFPHSLVLVPGEGDVILLVSDQPLVLHPEAADLFPARPLVKPDLARIGLGSLAEIAAFDRGSIGPPHPGGLLNTDDNSVIQYRLALELLRGAQVRGTLPLEFSWESVARTFFPGRSLNGAILQLAQVVERHDDMETLERIRQWLEQKEGLDAAWEVYRMGNALRDRLDIHARVEDLLDEAERSFQSHDLEAARIAIDKAEDLGLSTRSELFRAGTVAMNLRLYARAEPLLDRALALLSAESPYLPLVGRGASRVALGRREAGLADIAAAKAILPDDGAAYFYLGRALTDAGDRDAALAEFRAGIKAAPWENSLYSAVRSLLWPTPPEGAAPGAGAAGAAAPGAAPPPESPRADPRE